MLETPEIETRGEELNKKLDKLLPLLEKMAKDLKLVREVFRNGRMDWKHLFSSAHTRSLKASPSLSCSDSDSKKLSH